MNTLDFGLDNGGVGRHYLLGGIVVDLFFRFRVDIIGGKFVSHVFYVYL